MGGPIRFFRSNPWRTAALVLAVLLAGSTTWLLVADGRNQAAPALSGGGTTTTGPDQPEDTSPDLGPSLGVDPSASVPGDGVGYLSVKVDNATGARPQVGLAGASVLVEYPVEGGITRFIAVLDPAAHGLVGPVRSLRPVDADLLPALAPYVVSSGGQPFVIQDVAASGVGMIDPQFFELFTSGGRDPVHDLFLQVDETFAILGDPAPLGEGLPTGELPAGQTAEEIGLPWEGVVYRFEQGRYVRYQGPDPFEVLDAPDGAAAPLAHDSVVIMYVAERSAGYTDGNGVEVSTFDVVGAGGLLVFSGGQVVEGIWLRAARGDPYHFYTMGGEPFGIPRGSRYLGLVPRDSRVEW